MKHRSNAYPITRSDFSGNSTDKGMHYELTGRMGCRKYLRESCCHRIECSAANFLVAFMWIRLLNSTALTIPTHKGLERVSDTTSTQAVDRIINKWRAKIIGRVIYNVRDPWQRRDHRFIRESIVTVWTISVTIFNQYIYIYIYIYRSRHRRLEHPKSCH